MTDYNPFSLEGKTILVTGASSGIGKATAIECSRVGAKLIITGRNQERLEKTFNMLEGEKHQAISADLSDNSEINRVVEYLPRLDGCVLCAGIIKTTLFHYASDATVNDLFSINFFSPLRLSQKLVKQKKVSKNASMVFISSIGGLITHNPGNTIYGASKSALASLAKGMAIELAPKKIRVNNILPGMIETPLLSQIDIDDNQFKEDMQRYPLKRYGKPEEVAHAAIYLLSDASRWVTGSDLVIDGGLSLI